MNTMPAPVTLIAVLGRPLQAALSAYREKFHVRQLSPSNQATAATMWPANRTLPEDRRSGICAPGETSTPSARRLPDAPGSHFAAASVTGWDHSIGSRRAKRGADEYVSHGGGALLPHPQELPGIGAAAHHPLVAHQPQVLHVSSRTGLALARARQRRASSGNGPAFSKPSSSLMWLSRQRVWLILAWLLIVFALGGSSRPDAPTLPLLRATAIMVTAVGLATLTRAQIHEYRHIFAFSIAVLLLGLLHVVPLPPSVWMSLPGRGIIARVDEAAGLGELWRPLTMDVRWTWNAIWSLAIPFSILVHVVQVEREQHTKLIYSVLAIGLLSALVGIAQLLGETEGPLYLYPITNYGSPVGLFANRNHQAVFLAALVPIAFLWAGDMTARNRRELLWLRYGMSACLVGLVSLLILITGSRSGLITLMVSLAASLIWLRPGGQVGGASSNLRTAKTWMFGFAAATGLVLLLVMAIENERAVAVFRLLGDDPMADMRTRILPTVFDMISLYMPYGSGLGTFEPVYMIHEPDELLGPSYANHIHNDWLEILVTAGAPGALLLACAITGWCGAVWRLHGAKIHEKQQFMAIAALIILFLFGLGSVTDYPLRVPSVLSFVMLMAIMVNSIVTVRHDV